MERTEAHTTSGRRKKLKAEKGIDIKSTSKAPAQGKGTIISGYLRMHHEVNSGRAVRAVYKNDGHWPLAVAKGRAIGVHTPAFEMCCGSSAHERRRAEDFGMPVFFGTNNAKGGLDAIQRHCSIRQFCGTKKIDEYLADMVHRKSHISTAPPTQGSLYTTKAGQKEIYNTQFLRLLRGC